MICGRETLRLFIVWDELFLTRDEGRAETRWLGALMNWLAAHTWRLLENKMDVDGLLYNFSRVEVP